MGQTVTRNLSNIEKLQRKLSADGIDFEELRSILSETKSVISGSYIMQVILDETWSGSDIDIWSEKRHSKNMALLEPFFDFFVRRLGYSFRKIRTNNTQYSRLRENIKNIVSLKHPSLPRVQIITTRKSHREAIATFDLDVCRVYYMPVVNQILEQSGYFSSIEPSMGKYESKIMTVTHESMSTQSMKEWLRTLQRIIKYRGRGFTIDCSDVVEHIRNMSNDTTDETKILFLEQWNRIVFTNFEVYDRSPPILKGDFFPCINSAEVINVLRQMLVDVNIAPINMEAAFQLVVPVVRSEIEDFEVNIFAKYNMMNFDINGTQTTGLIKLQSAELIRASGVNRSFHFKPLLDRGQHVHLDVVPLREQTRRPARTGVYTAMQTVSYHAPDGMDLIVPDSNSVTKKKPYLQDAPQLREKLTRNMINFDKLKDILIETNSVIAGSYIIQALLGEEWATDMDVWCKQPALRNLTMPAPFYEYFVKSLGYRFKRIPMEPKHDYTRLEKYVTDIVSLVHPNPGFPIKNTNHYHKKITHRCHQII